MPDICDLCRRDALEFLYRAEPSPRGISVHLCAHCGLVQSLPRADRAPRRDASVSSGADWGNVRYGKGFRTEAAMAALARHAELSETLSLLDVGSNRGSFARAFLAAAPHAGLVAVEPDERVADACAGLARTELVSARIEDAALETGRFDIVHSCHTLEHVAEAARVLADHWRVLKDGGLLLVDVPNIALIGTADILEEWFIDKHLYHFSARTLTRMIEAAGFEIVEQPDPDDLVNLLVIARKRALVPRRIGADPREVAAARMLAACYREIRGRNLAALAAVAEELRSFAHRGVAVWGAGRLFDSLVVHGGFDARALSLLIDKHLKTYMDECHGCRLSAPEDLARVRPGVVVVMSRSFAGEIAAEARRLAPGIEVVFYTDLMNRARLGRAA